MAVLNFIITLLILFIVLGVIITIHEFGHFISAKKSGVYVEEFSIGMGPKLGKIKRKNDVTKYTIRLLPIGGYVSMANAEGDIKGIKKDEILENKSFIKRFLVLIMGIIFNFILTFILLLFNGIVFGSPDTKATLGTIVEDSPAYYSGLKEGDVIVKVDDVNTYSWDDVLLEISVKESKESYAFKVLRGKETLNINVTPEIKEVEGEKTKTFGFAMGQSKTYGFANAFKYACTEWVNMSRSLFTIIGNLLNGSVSTKNLSGPVGIFTVIDQIKATGLENIIYLIAYLSINVGIVNLFPIPVFDGGRILLLIIEKIIGKKTPEKLEIVLNYVGFALMMLLMLYVTFNDILKLF